MSGSRRPALLVPVLWLSDRVRTSTRLVVLVVVLLVPGLSATDAYTSSVGGQLAFTGAERDGTVVVLPALEAMTEMAAGRAPDLAPLRAAVAAHPELKLADLLAAVPPGGGAAATAALGALVTEAANSSNLILDPDLDSFYVMDILVVELPKTLVATAQAAAPDTTAAPSARVAAQAVQAGAMQGAAQAIRDGRKTAAGHTADPSLAADLAPLESAADTITASAGALTASLDRPGPVDPSAVTAKIRQILGPTMTVLQRLLDTRYGHLAEHRTITLTITAVAAVIAVWLAAAVWWRTRHDVRLAVAAVTAVATGDLSPRGMPSGRDEFGDIGRALERSRQRLTEQDEQLRGAHRVREEQLHASFEQQREGQRQLRVRAQAVVDESVSAITEELRGVVAQVDEVRAAARTIEDRVTAADQATASVVERAEQAERVVTALGESLRQVDGTTRLIAGIAAQTRLLALNATIEAARAGEAGRGFTVVADEVKDLASDTAESTEQIAATVASLERDAEQMTATISAIVTGVGGVGAATRVLHGVAMDQHAVVQRLDRRVNETLERIHGMSALAEKLERRHTERIAATGPVRIGVDGGLEYVTGELVDLSVGGLRCRAAREVPIDSGDAVSIELQLGGEPLRVHGQVVHCVRQEQHTDLGLQFIGAAMDVVARLEHYVEPQS